MKISELETHLQVLRAKHGDVEVVMEVAGPWLFAIDTVRIDHKHIVIVNRDAAPINWGGQRYVCR